MRSVVAFKMFMYKLYLLSIIIYYILARNMYHVCFLKYMFSPLQRKTGTIRPAKSDSKGPLTPVPLPLMSAFSHPIPIKITIMVINDGSLFQGWQAEWDTQH